jgi:hypothetical protein
MTTTNAICTWDCTIPANKYTKDQIIKWCNDYCKKWCFQLERGEKTNYEHYQLRCSTKVKTRNMTKHLKPGEWSPTSNENKDNDFYTTKDETRIDGPWSDQDEVIYIPKQIRNITLLPWQEQARLLSLKEEYRKIYIIFDPEGCSGKSTFGMYMHCNKFGRIVPPINNAKDLMRMVCDIPTSGCYILDLPRSYKKSELRGTFVALEQIKNGYVYDDRFKFKEKIIDSPVIWVFTNKLPNPKYLSKDRWAYFAIQNKQLVNYVPKPEDFIKKKLKFLGYQK